MFLALACTGKHGGCTEALAFDPNEVKNGVGSGRARIVSLILGASWTLHDGVIHTPAGPRPIKHPYCPRCSVLRKNLKLGVLAAGNQLTGDIGG